METMIDQLEKTILERKANPSAKSYTAQLFAAGRDEIAKKVGEEGVEVVLAGVAQSDERLISEAADLVYHLLVLLAERGVTWQQVTQELQRRHQ